MALRRSKVERNARQLADAFAAAEAELHEREERLRSIETEVAEETAEAAAALGLGELTAAEFEKRKRDADTRAEEARAACATAFEVVEALRPRAADAEEAVARRKVEAAEADEHRSATAIEGAETALVKLRGEHALASERLALVLREAVDARAPFDPEVALAAAARAESDRELASWLVWNPASGHPVPPYLRETVAAMESQKLAEVEAGARSLRAHPDRVDPAEVFGDGLRPGQPFPRLPMPGDAL
ncbi:MAG: hypothetical protein H0U00_06885 [Actinobacteria bacterium]|nr:hypothetical protein [Actinomycetota bacterium]